MSKLKVKFPKRYKWLFSSLLMASWISGLTFFILNKWITIEGDFGPEKHPWQFPTLQIHGAAAFLMMISFGYILGAHVPPSWKPKRMRKFGISIIATSSRC